MKNRHSVFISLVLASLSALAIDSFAQGGPTQPPDDPRFALGLGVISAPRPLVYQF